MLLNSTRRAIHRVSKVMLGLIALEFLFAIAGKAHPPPPRRPVIWNIGLHIPSSGNTLTFSLTCKLISSGAQVQCPGGQTTPKEITIWLGDEVQWSTDQNYSSAEIIILHEDDILDTDHDGKATYHHHGKGRVGGVTDAGTPVDPTTKHEYYVTVKFTGKTYRSGSDPRIIVGGARTLDEQIDEIVTQVKALIIPDSDQLKIQKIVDELNALKN